MARIPGLFVPLDVNYPRDRAIRRAGPEAELVFIRGLVFTKGTKTDGFLADFDLDAAMVGLKPAWVKKGVDALVKVGLWTVVDDGWQVRSWAKWNSTQEQIAEDQEAKREGGKQGNHKRWHVEKNKVDPKCDLCVTDRTTDRYSDSDSDRTRVAEIEVEVERDRRQETEERPSGRPGLSVVSTSSSSRPSNARAGR